MKTDMVKLGVTLAVAALMFTLTAMVGQIMTDMGYSEQRVEDAMMYTISGVTLVGLIAMIFTFSWINGKARGR